MDTTIPHLEHLGRLTYRHGPPCLTNSHPNGAYPAQNHKGDLWIYFAGRLYDEERNDSIHSVANR
jgi:hypothetical protein